MKRIGELVNRWFDIVDQLKKLLKTVPVYVHVAVGIVSAVPVGSTSK